ncbi:MAG: PEGA domain-containing protein [Alistipes sp.]|nr:PEGA domain-containing protein [Alistipes sp.]
MKRFVAILTLLFVAFAASAQSENSIIIDQNSFRPLQSDALTGVNIDPIGVDSSRRPCARIKMKINRMSREDIDKLDVKIVTNNQLTKCKTADYENGLILEMTAKPATRFYLDHPEFGQSNEVTLNLEPNKEYYMEASLNQTYSIVVNSNVTDAEVYLDGEYKGRTDNSNSLTIKEVFIGEHTLKLTYGNISHEQKIEVNSGKISFRQNVDTAASEPQFVVFTVEPQSAVVIINNQHYTLTDGAMNVVLDSGTYNYTVTAAGYHPQSGTFSVAGSKVSKNITLSADSATVTLTAPDNAEIWVNGVMKGTSHWSGTLNSGTYIFEARKAGHKSSTLSKHITSAEPRQSYTLPAPTPIVGSLIISGTPINADVTLDNKAVGQMPLKLNDILVGEHTIVVSKSGYETYTQSIAISEGKTVTVNATLAKITSTNPQTASVPPRRAIPAGVTSASYKVGDYYNDGTKEGVVFEVSDNGRSGKIVSMIQSTEKIRWASDDVKYKQIGTNSQNNGVVNMNIVKAIDGWESKYPAFKWCTDLGEGWYLPAKDELDLLSFNTAVHDAVDKTLIAKGGIKLYSKGINTDNYWSSTEWDNSCAYRADFWASLAMVWRDDKQFGHTVRAVAVFGTEITSAPYKVGDYYNDGTKEGVVFEVSADGKHGKIVSMTQSATAMQWTSNEKEQKRLIGADSETDGAANMAKVKARPDWQSKYPAFKWCTDLGDGWYLPAIEEFKKFILDDTIHDVVNRTLAAKGGKKLYNKGERGGWYWSSTERDYRARSGEFCAWLVSMLSGDTNFSSKHYDYYVRAVAKF